MSAKKTHGMTNSPEFAAWMCMKRRCYNKGNASYPNYGGRGIVVCERWLVFENFLHDMGMKPFAGATIERNDNDIGYEPGNCRWATMKEQQNNRSNNRLLTIDGTTKTMKEWSELSGVKYGTIAMRLTAGWKEKEAVFSKTLSFQECGKIASKKRWKS